MEASSHIILNKELLKGNWEFLRAYFQGKKISAVVKGNAYGHGIEAYVPMAEACGVDHFSVFNAGEAYRVHEVAAPGSTIMVMGALDEADIEWAIENGIEFYVFNFQRLDAAVRIAQKLAKKAIIHIELETGMYRTGFEEQEIATLIEKLRAASGDIVFRGLCMHFAGAEHITNYVRIRKQKINFKMALKKFRQAGLMPEMIHACCSAAAIRYPDMHYDMLRIGILQYGFWPSPEILIEYLSKHEAVMSPLKRIISWESMIMGLKEVPPGEFVGYGASYFSHQAMQLALVPIGYAHGFSRSLSNSGIVLINGYRVPVVGMVNMNCIAVDVTGLPAVAINDKVTMIGRQGEHEISVASFGEMSNQLNYELLTRLPTHIPRYVQ
ncbi:MAG: alanine racemase [Bacteroidetes bacterium 46-16]|nr:MAG: alanine racemase [Bacteroidetes bacterium 46-16]